MLENNEGLNILNIKNLGQLSFSAVLSSAVDANVNIKTILSVQSYIYDTSAEAGSGKAVLTGKIGVKVLYLDTDNMTNTHTLSQSFSETVQDSAISADSRLNISAYSTSNSILSSDKTLKINCEVTLSPVLYATSGGLADGNSYENMIVRTKELTTLVKSFDIDTSLTHTQLFETKSPVSKILANSSYFSLEKATPYDGHALLEGKIFTTLLVDTGTDGESEIKELTDTAAVKHEIELSGANADTVLDLDLSLDPSKEGLSTEAEDGQNLITIEHTLRVSGVALRPVTLELADDLYSLDNEVELKKSERTFHPELQQERITDTISGDISLGEDEPAIDYIISNQNICPEITNLYLKDGTLTLEGVVTSDLIYMDENKQPQRKALELPFFLDSKIKLENLGDTHAVIHLTDCRTRSKRGTVVELEYGISVIAYLYTSEITDTIANLTIGKALDFSQYDYQIYIARPNETLWELSKRIKITPDALLETNPTLPATLTGTERVIIKR